jgi:hypothetical protein
MTADLASHEKNTGSSTLLYTLSMIFAVLTIFFAVLSMIFGNRLTTLHARYLNMQNQTAKSENTSIREMQAALNKATLDFHAAQQALNAEKATSEQLRQQLSATRKDLEKARTELTLANQTITRLKTTLQTSPAPQLPRPSGSKSAPVKPPAAAPPAAEPQSSGAPPQVPPATTSASPIGATQTPSATSHSVDDERAVPAKTDAGAPQPSPKGAVAAE